MVPLLMFTIIIHHTQYDWLMNLYMKETRD